LLGAQLAIAAAAIFARYALSGAGPLAVSALRLALAALVALAIAGRFARLSRGREFAFGLAGLALAIHFATWIGSLEFTSVAVSTLLVTTTPLWTELYDVVRERRLPSRAFIVSLALALTGVALLVSARASVPAPVPGRELLGDGLALAGSVAIGAYLLLVREAGNEPVVSARSSAGAVAGSHAPSSSEPGSTQPALRLGTRQVIARTFSWSALALVVAATVARQPPPAFADAPAWGGIFAMALVSQMLGHTALNAALHDFSPSTISLTTLLEPVFAALLAAVLFHEALTLQAIAGGILVLAAVAVTLRFSTLPRRPLDGTALG
jgi:drug/metabolite transporter (DMT)-like permease